MMRHWVLAVGATVALGGVAQAQSGRWTIGGAANVSARGVESPYYVLARPAVQDLAQRALARPLTAREVEEAMTSDGEVKLANLLALDVLRPTADRRYALGFMVGTAGDKARLRAVASPAGRSLADAIFAERHRFEAVFAKYDMPVDRGLLRMTLIGAVMLDWDGLGVTADHGYRAAPARKPNGDKFQMTMLENAPGVSVRALYWGSHNGLTDDGSVVLTTFGDHENPRRLGFPDISSRISPRDLEPHAPSAVARLLALELGEQLMEHQNRAGHIMLALRQGPLSVSDLATHTQINADLVTRTLHVLEALRYVERNGEAWRAKIPVFTSRDAAFIQEFRELGREVMLTWLRNNYNDIKVQLSDLGAVKAGVPYDVVFTQIWHDVFGWANYYLVREGYLYDPYGPDAEFVSFAPFVWTSPLNLYEGTKIF